MKLNNPLLNKNDRFYKKSLKFNERSEDNTDTMKNFVEKIKVIKVPKKIDEKNKNLNDQNIITNFSTSDKGENPYPIPYTKSDKNKNNEIINNKDNNDIKDLAEIVPNENEKAKISNKNNFNNLQENIIEKKEDLDSKKKSIILNKENIEIFTAENFMNIKYFSKKLNINFVKLEDNKIDKKTKKLLSFIYPKENQKNFVICCKQKNMSSLKETLKKRNIEFLLINSG